MIDPDHSSNRVRSIVSLILRSAVALILLLLLFHFVDFSEIATSFLAARLEYVGGAVVLLAANLGLQIFKWRYFVRLVNPESSNLETAASLLFGISLGTLTPGQIGEFGGRALRHNSVASGAVLGLTLVDKLQMLCVMGIGGVVSSAFLFHLGGAVAVTIVLIASAGFGYFFFNPKIILSVAARLHLRVLSRPLVQDFLSAVSVFKPKHLIVALAFSVAFYAVIYLQMLILLNAFSNVSPEDAFLGFAAMMFFKSLVPISLGDLGTREASSVYFYSLRGITASTSFNAALLLFVINLLFPSILGLVFMPRFSSK